MIVCCKNKSKENKRLDYYVLFPRFNILLLIAKHKKQFRTAIQYY